MNDVSCRSAATTAAALPVHVASTLQGCFVVINAAGADVQAETGRARALISLSVSCRYFLVCLCFETSRVLMVFGV